MIAQYRGRFQFSNIAMSEPFLEFLTVGDVDAPLRLPINAETSRHAHHPTSEEQPSDASEFQHYAAAPKQKAHLVMGVYRRPDSQTWWMSLQVDGHRVRINTMGEDRQ